MGSAAFFSGPQYTIPQLCYRSAQNAITQCFQICQCAVRNAAIADTSATHNHSKEKIKLQNKKNQRSPSEQLGRLKKGLKSQKR